MREHVHAFRHLGGVARVCLYDNFKAVVPRHDADGPLYNPKFLAFARIGESEDHHLSTARNPR